MSNPVRMPPQNLDAELSVIGMMLMDPKAISIVRAILPDPTACFFDVHQRIMAKIYQMADDGTAVDVINTSIMLAEEGLLKDVGGSEYLEKCVQHRPAIENLAFYGEKVKASFERRKLISHYEQSLTQCYNPAHSIEETLAATITVANSLSDGLVSKSPFAVMTSAELDEADLHTDYLVEDVLARHQPCILAGPRKNLKTNISIDLALSLGSGAKFLDKFYVPRAVRVALMSGESGDAVIQETARRIARSKPWINLSDYTNCIWSFDLPKLGRPQTKATLIKFIKDNRLDVLIIDPIYLALELGDDAGNVFAVGQKLIVLTEVMRETGCSIVIDHHTRKPKKETQFLPSELEDIAWSGFQEWARQWLLLGRREAYDPEQSGSHKLWLSVGGSAGHSGLWGLDIEEGSRKDPGGRKWEVSVEVASAVIAETVDANETAKEEQSQIKTQKQLEADKKKLLAEIRKRPDGETEKFYRERASLSGTRAGKAFDKLVADKLIESCEVAKGNRTFPGLRLVNANRESIGTESGLTGNNPACPDESTEAGLLPLRGSPDPAHRDIERSLFERAVGPSPDGYAEASF